jgi:hypothetical protein
MRFRQLQTCQIFERQRSNLIVALKTECYITDNMYGHIISMIPRKVYAFHCLASQHGSAIPAGQFKALDMMFCGGLLSRARASPSSLSVYSEKRSTGREQDTDLGI